MCLVFVGCDDTAYAPIQTQIDNAQLTTSYLLNRIYELEKQHYRMWKLSNTHEIKQDEIIALLLDYLMLEVVEVPEVRSRIELKSTFIE